MSLLYQPNAVANNSEDSLTVLVCCKENTATKKFSKDGKKIVKTAYNAGYKFCVMQRKVNGIEELSGNLRFLEDRSSAFIIRGQPLPHVKLEESWNRNNKNFKTPALGLRYALFDFDNIEMPEGLSLRKDKIPAFEFLISKLPPEYHNVSYHWQLSSSAGMSKESKLSAHIWFYFNRPVSDLELREFADYVNKQSKCKLIDSALFRDVQPHFTAAPIFEGVKNPFPERSGLVVKKNSFVLFKSYVSPKEAIKRTYAPSKRQKSTEKQRLNPEQNNTISNFDILIDSIGDHEGGNGFNDPIIRAIASYVGSNGKEGTDIEWLYDYISKKVLAANRSQHTDSYIKIKASRKYIITAINSAIKKFGDKGQSNKSKLISGIEPPKRKKTKIASDAHAELAQRIASWF